MRITSLFVVLCVPALVHAQDWKVIDSNNFRIYYIQEKEYAEKVAALAEKTRTEIAKKWFGSSKDWNKQCHLYLHPSQNSIEAESGILKGTPAFTRVSTRKNVIELREIHVRVDHEGVWKNALPHEITHALITDQLGYKGCVPRWLDEGMAVLAESKDNINAHRKKVLKNKDNLYDLKTLITTDKYLAKVDVFYGQSVLLVQFLVTKKGEREFIRFARRSASHGFEDALKTHYKMTYDELQAAWLKTLEK